VYTRDMSVISVNQSACSLFVYTALDSIYIDDEEYRVFYELYQTS